MQNNPWLALQAEMQLLVPTHKLSTNDVLSAVLWNMACDIRGRPRPFRPNSRHHGCLAYPLNLRGVHVPQEYCGNALLLNLLAGTKHAILTCFQQSLSTNTEQSSTSYTGITLFASLLDARCLPIAVCT